MAVAEHLYAVLQHPGPRPMLEFHVTWRKHVWPHLLGACPEGMTPWHPSWHWMNWPIRNRAILDDLSLTDAEEAEIEHFLCELRDTWPSEAEVRPPMSDVFRAVDAVTPGAVLKDTLWFINQKLERCRQVEIRSMDQAVAAQCRRRALQGTRPYGGGCPRPRPRS